MERIIEQSCLECLERSDRLFCDLPAEALKAFDALKSIAIYPRGSALFREGAQPKGIFVLCDGRARLTVCSESGRRMTVRIAGPGEILGLSACLAGTPHELTAELLDNAQIAMVKRKDLMGFLHDHREACMQVVSLLSQDLHLAYDRVRAVGMGKSRRPRTFHVH
jgi:CRP/FNR family transcriptional regulator, cyclic AMP receptor protein